MFQYNLLKRLILFLALSLGGIAAEEYTEADLGVSIDYSRFSIEGGVYLDIYLMIPQSTFLYFEADSGLEAKVVFQTALIQDGMVPYPPDRWQRVYKAADNSAIASLSYVPDISKFYVEAGDYLLQVDIVDVNSNRRQRIKKPISLEIFPSGQLAISDITIASQIVKAITENEFTKYGNDVVPNAERTFSPSAPMMYYYFETYGLSGSGNYQMHAQVLSLNEDVVQDYPIRTKKMPGSSAVEWGGVNTAGLKSGIHKLKISMTDEVSAKSVSSLKTFYVLRPKSVANNTTSTTQTDYTGLSEDQLNEIFNVVSLIMDKKERRLFKSSDSEGKRNILTAFWDRKDPDPDTAQNEFKMKFYSRVQLVNREYGSETDEGWQTDRGRILIHYGRPNNVETHPSSLDQKPWESWHYYGIEGGIEFIFIDRSGYGKYQLVHSTARDEVQDYSWQRYLD
ncbi:GWxTD domain-containing protein [bacterium]|nr:GWxTD domain-containing protein [bacterium]